MMMKQQLDSNKKEQEILDLWNIINDTQCEYSKDKFIYMLFEEQAKKGQIKSLSYVPISNILMVN